MILGVVKGLVPEVSAADPVVIYGSRTFLSLVTGGNDEVIVEFDAANARKLRTLITRFLRDAKDA